MKKIIFIIFALTLAGILLLAFQYRSRAQISPTMLVKITYNNDTEFEKAFDGSTSVHYFYEQPTGKSSYMISLLTQNQFDRLGAQGLKGEIIDENPDMSKYMIIYSPQAAPAQSFAQIGEVEALDTRFTLVKANSAAQFENHDTLVEDDVAIFTYSIDKPLAKPKLKTVRTHN